MSDYTPSGNPVAQSRGTSPSIRAEFQLIATAVNSKPDLDTPNTFTSPQTFSAGIVTVGGTYTGANDFSGGTVVVPTPTLATHAVTKAYADALSMTAGNVATGGTSNQLYKKNSGTDYDASWTSVKTVGSQSILGSGDIPFPVAGLTLIATLTPTAAANVDFLSTFNSTYDNYLVVVQGIKPSSDDVLRIRLATGGSVDTGSKYFSISESSPATAATSAFIGSVISAGLGMGFTFDIQNANDTTNAKTASIGANWQSSGTEFSTARKGLAYNATNAISGFRLYWSAGANFAATGKVYVYGYSKT